MINYVYLKNLSNESGRISLIPLKESFIRGARHLGLTEDVSDNPSRSHFTYVLWFILQYKLFDYLIMWREPGSSSRNGRLKTGCHSYLLRI